MKKGFTLIEVLVVVAILSVLGVSVFVALNPQQRIRESQDARRSSDADSILTAIHQCVIDNDGDLTLCGLTADGVERQIGTSTGTPSCVISTGGCNVTAAANCVDLDADAELNPYLASFPVDPVGGTASLTKYTVTAATTGIITVKACGSIVATPPVSVSR